MLEFTAHWSLGKPRKYKTNDCLPIKMMVTKSSFHHILECVGLIICNVWHKLEITGLINEIGKQNMVTSFVRGLTSFLL